MKAKDDKVMEPAYMVFSFLSKAKVNKKLKNRTCKTQLKAIAKDAVLSRCHQKSQQWKVMVHRKSCWWWSVGIRWVKGMMEVHAMKAWTQECSTMKAEAT
ncbi:unnamed protein product [Lupinus luteus]|uniref:Uncharacterized protein n=1 Tax=Lupinus luteus TaxID=3873 RepID=A0AAV1WTZ2_LUPLU